MSSLPYFVQQLLYQGPLLLAGLFGLVMGAIYLKRCTGPAVLTLIAMIVMILTTIVVICIQSYIFNARYSQGLTATSYAQLSQVVALLGAVIKGLAVGAVIAAVFMGRRPAGQG